MPFPYTRAQEETFNPEETFHLTAREIGEILHLAPNSISRKARREKWKGNDSVPKLWAVTLVQLNNGMQKGKSGRRIPPLRCRSPGLQIWDLF